MWCDILPVLVTANIFRHWTTPWRIIIREEKKMLLCIPMKSPFIWVQTMSSSEIIQKVEDVSSVFNVASPTYYLAEFKSISNPSAPFLLFLCVSLSLWNFLFNGCDIDNTLIRWFICDFIIVSFQIVQWNLNGPTENRLPSAMTFSAHYVFHTSQFAYFPIRKLCIVNLIK